MTAITPESGADYLNLDQDNVGGALSPQTANVSSWAVNLPAILSAIKAPQPDLASFKGTGPLMGDLGKSTGSGPDFWSAAKNVLDYISTPFYMATNAALNLSNSNDLSSIPDDIAKGIQQGWDAGVNHNTDNAHDWTDVLKNIETKNGVDPNTVQEINALVGVPADILLDPVNLASDDLTGIGKGIVKGIPDAINAFSEAGSKAGRAVADAGAKAEKIGVEPGAETLSQEGEKAAQSAAQEGGASESGGGVATAEKAPETSSLTPEEARSQFENMPQIASIIGNQGKSRIGAAGSAFLSTFKDSVADSKIGKLLKSVQETPIPATPENVAKAHAFGVTDADELSKSPVANMAVPKTEEIKPEATEKAPVEATPKEVDTKETDLINSAANNTLADEVWRGMPSQQRDATRVAKAYKDWHVLDEDYPVEINGSKLRPEEKVDNIPAFTQKAWASEIANDTKRYQAGIIDEKGNVLPELGKKGHVGDEARAEGASAKEAGGIRHPLVYDTHANQRPWQILMDKLAYGKGEVDSTLLKRGSANQPRYLSTFAKPRLAARVLKAAESQLFAKRMVPTLEMSRYAEGRGPIHLSMGDTLDAAVQKSIYSGKGDARVNTSLINEGTVTKHLIGGGKENAINPMTWLTAVETLIHGRDRIFNAIKRAGGTASQKTIDIELKKLENDIYSVLTVKDSAFNPIKTTKADMANMRRTVDEADAAREEKGIEKPYEKDMQELAHALVHDPQYGSMLEQRHLYNWAMHKADLDQFKAKNWDGIKDAITKFAQSNWTPKQVNDWLNKAIKSTKNAIPDFDRNEFGDWIKDMRAKIVTPAEETAINGTARDTIVDSGKDSAPVVAKGISAEEAFPMTITDLRIGQLVTDVVRAVHPVRYFFDAKFPWATGFYDVVMEGKHSRTRMQNLTQQVMGDFLRKYPKGDQLRDDFALIQRGDVDGEPLSGSAQELDTILNHFVGSDNRYIQALSNKKLSASYFKKMMDNHAVSPFIDKDWLGHAKWTDLPDFWKHTNLKDSEETADFLSKMHNMVTKIYEDQSTVAQFEKLFGSEVPKEGYVKVTWGPQSRGSSTDIVRSKGYAAERTKAEKEPGFYDALNRDLYYERTAALEIPLIHRIMNESRRLDDTTMLGKFANNVLDPVTQIMKAFQTTFRPGHWVSNLMGDHIRLYMAGVTPAAMAPSYRVMSAVGRDMGMFKDIPSKLDRQTRLAQKDYKWNLPEGDAQIPIGAGRWTMGATEIGRRAEDVGILVSPHAMGQHEDYLSDFEHGNASRLIKAVNGGLDKVLNAKLAGKSIQELSALRDNVTRMPLAMHILMNDRTSKTVDEAFTKAFAFVRKWAPTSMDFTREESMYARRAIMYYTWLRGMLPNVVETIMMKPGVFLAPNKAMYAIAKANGVNPMSIGNPFPADQMFPSYYYQNVIGPQMVADGHQLWGFSPMAPTADVLDTMLSGINSTNAKQNSIVPAVGENFQSMLNPFLQIPSQLATGQSNGIPIKDPLEYVQDQVLPPQLDLISKLTGKDINGMNRTDLANKNMTPNVPGTGLSPDLWNFLTGTHATDYNSTPAEKAVAGENKAVNTATRNAARRANS